MQDVSHRLSENRHGTTVAEGEEEASNRGFWYGLRQISDT